MPQPTKTDARRTWAAVGLYALGFCLVALAHAWPYIRQQTYFIWGADGFTQHFTVFCYLRQYGRQVAAQLLHGNFRIPLYSFSLGLGGDILTTLNYYGLGNPFYLLGLAAPESALPLVYSLLLVLQMFLGGLLFFAFCRKLGRTRAGSVLGAWAYVFGGFYLMAVEHPIMAHAVFYLPLLLLGCEKVLRRESPLPLMLGVFALALTGFYFLFICSVALAVFVLLRVWAMQKGDYWRRLGQGILHSLVAYLAGLLAAGALFVPCLLAYLNSGRASAGTGWHKALWGGVAALWGQLLGVLSPANPGFVAVLCLLAVPVLLLAKGQRRAPLLVAVLLCAALAVSPFLQAALIGFGDSQYTRFWFATSFVLALVLAAAWPSFMHLTLPQQLVLGGVAAALVVLALRRPGDRAALVAAVCAVCAFAACMLVRYCPGARRVGAAALAAVVLGNLAWGLYTGADAVVGSYRTARFARIMPAVTAQTLPEGEYRVDVSDVALHQWWASANAALAGDYKGLSEYFSVLDATYTSAMIDDWSLAGAQQGAFSFQSLDGCAALNTLAAVRYAFVRPGEESYVPYGYQYVGDTVQGPAFTFTPDSGNTLLRYENQYALPLGYAYGAVISGEAYAALNPLQKQAAMLQGAAVATPPEGWQTVQPDVTAVQPIPSTLQPQPQMAEGLVLAAPADDFAEYTLQFTAPANSELHLCLAALRTEPGQTCTGLDVTLEGGVTRSIYMGSGVNPEEAWLNLGYTEAGGPMTATLRLEAGQGVTLDDLQLWSFDMSAYAENAQALAAGGLQNVVVGTNSVQGLAVLEQSGVVCLAVPYSTGWRATIDGQPAELQRANSLYMALAVPAGEHALRIYYVTPGLKIGAVCSVLGLLAGLALLWAYHRQKAKKDKQERKH